MKLIDLKNVSDLMKTFDYDRRFQFLDIENMVLPLNNVDSKTIINGFKDKIYRSVVIICGNYLLANTKELYIYNEINPWLKIHDSEKCFWECIEIEKKFDIFGEIDICKLITTAPSALRQYSFSKLNCCVGNEHFVRLFNDNYERYYTILTDAYAHKSIKIKSAIPQYDWAREVILAPFNDDEEHLYQEKIMNNCQFKISRFPSIHKEKYRYIIVDDEGWVWGLSISKAITYDERHIKSEIELEFWSRIMPSGSLIEKTIDDILFKLEEKMIEIKNWLDINAIKYVYPGEKKYDWFRRNFKK